MRWARCAAVGLGAAAGGWEAGSHVALLERGWEGAVADLEYREKVWDALVGPGEAGASTRLERDKGPEGAARRQALRDAAPSECDAVLRAARTSGVGLAAAARRSPGSVAACRDDTGRTALMHAALRGDLDGVDACFKANPAAVSERDVHGLTPLTFAAWRGHTEVIDYLLNRGADPRTHDDFGVLPLHKAVGHGRREAALRLISDGATDVNARTAPVSDAIPEHYGARSRQQTALHIACAREAHGAHVEADPRLVALLLRYGASPDLADVAGDTPLHAAAQAGDVAVVRLLLRAGARPTVANHRGERPLDLLPEDAHPCLFELLSGAP